MYICKVVGQKRGNEERFEETRKGIGRNDALQLLYAACSIGLHLGDDNVMDKFGNMESASLADRRLTGVTGERRRLQLLIAVAACSVLAVMASSEQAATALASPALAVKAGRERG